MPAGINKTASTSKTAPHVTMRFKNQFIYWDDRFLFLLSRRSQIVDMPEDTLVAHLRMFSQEHICERQRSRIVLKLGKNPALSLRLLLHSQLTKEKHQVVVGAQIFRIDRQNLFITLARDLVVVLDLAELAELLQRHAVSRIRSQH